MSQSIVPTTDAAQPEVGERMTHVDAPQWRLVLRRFRRHKLALVGTFVLAILLLVVIFAEFLAPFGSGDHDERYTYAPPQRVHFVHDGDFGPYVYDYHSTVDDETLERTYVVDESRRVPLGFFVKGTSYKLFGLIETDIHFFGPRSPDDRVYLLGADRQGRDVLSRVIYGARISLSVGLVGVIVSLILGTVIGGISGFYGGKIDTAIQRVIEFFMSIPSIPLWLGFAAAIPPSWGPVRTYFAITIILSLISWTDLARVVRGRFLSLRNEDFVMAAELDAVSKPGVILRQMLPAMTSHIIAALTLAIPAMILAETALSFLGLGLQPPAVSWGVLLQESQNIRAVVTSPWLLFPGLAVMITVLALNFVGDGLRDSADPYG